MNKGTANANKALMEWLDDKFSTGELTTRERYLLFRAHKDRRERFNLFHFLWANGLPPHWAEQAVLWHDTYDKSAHRQVGELKLKAEENPEFFKKYRVRYILEVNEPKRVKQTLEE